MWVWLSEYDKVQSAKWLNVIPGLIWFSIWMFFLQILQFFYIMCEAFVCVECIESVPERLFLSADCFWPRRIQPWVSSVSQSTLDSSVFYSFLDWVLLLLWSSSVLLFGCSAKGDEKSRGCTEHGRTREQAWLCQQRCPCRRAPQSKAKAQHVCEVVWSSLVLRKEESSRAQSGPKFGLKGDLWICDKISSVPNMSTEFRTGEDDFHLEEEEEEQFTMGMRGVS